MGSVLDVVRETQLPVLAVVLLLGAVAKFADRSQRGQGPAVLLPVGWRRAATLAHGVAEGTVAFALLGASGAAGGAAARIAAAALFACGVAALVVLRRTAPETGCGCFGGLSTAPVDWRSIARSALLAVSALAAVGVPATAAGVVVGASTGHAAVVAIETVLLGVLSPESAELARRATRRVPCAVREVPLKRTLARLRASDLWRINAALLEDTEPKDVWRHGCWRFVLFTGRRTGRCVDVVFGVPVEGRRPGVRAVIADRETGTLLSVLGGPADGGRADPVPATASAAADDHRAVGRPRAPRRPTSARQRDLL
ncbi:MauE/DoxX family redox-associated membrane protein [Streptomonospora alba]|uniref:MauE/DoxX family redox-associated membrane protein n=1 Tax=Streptomonospora alba TaxID=183763 RepID=UPI001EE6FB39|nr:MauE/DoxX family redox-associated membrane protein [Streptomonospora alba]